MNRERRQLRIGIVLLVLAGVLLFGSVVFGVAQLQVAGAVAVRGLAAGAVLVGTAGYERPV